MPSKRRQFQALASSSTIANEKILCFVYDGPNLICTMDLSKYPLEKLFYFVAGVVPGFIALLIYQAAAPGSFGWFFTLGFLGYKTKLSLISLAAFLIGNSMTTFLRGFLGAMGGAMGAVVAQQPYKPAHSYDVAP